MFRLRGEKSSFRYDEGFLNVTLIIFKGFEYSCVVCVGDEIRTWGYLVKI